jgi:hypothetical protein
MRTHVRILQIGGILIAGILLAVTAVRSQAPIQSAQTWEYSSIMASPALHPPGIPGSPSTAMASAIICYATPQGCRNEEVTATISRTQDGGEAMMKAAANLGEQGWELTTASSEVNSEHTTRILYFRRLKRVKE